jgi:Toluene-4-monooxygenase system protein B (TmoB)
MPVPLYGFLEGDIVGLLMLAEESETVLALARKLQDAASIRVARRDECDVSHNGRTIDLTLTVKEAGLQPLDRFDVVWRRTT